MLLLLSTMEDDQERSFMVDLYLEYRGAMYDAAFDVMRQHQDTEDILHDTLLKLMKKTSLLRTFDCFTLRAYIVISVRRTAIDCLRRRGARGELLFAHDDYLDTLVPGGEGADDALLEEADHQQLRRMLGTLEPRQRDLLHMKYFLGISDEEIADSYGLKPASVRSLLSRARKALAEAIRREQDEEV